MDKIEHIIYDSRDVGENDDYSLADERENLDKELDNPVFCIADLGLWDGRHSGYKVLSCNLADILSAMTEGELKFYYDGKDVKCDQFHHDGTNYITFREMREGKDENEFAAICFNGYPTEEQIEEYTTSLGEYVRDIYGW